MTVGILPLPAWFRGLAREHPALMLTLAYLVPSVVGLMFSWEYYRHFGVNYFVFAEVTDVLLAVLREPISLLAAALGIGLIYLMYIYGHWELRKLEARPSPGRFLKGYLRVQRWVMNSSWLMVGLLALYMLIFVGWYAGHRFNVVTAGDHQPIAVSLSGNDASASLHLIGSSGRFVFLYNRSRNETLVITDESLGHLRFPQPDQK